MKLFKVVKGTPVLMMDYEKASAELVVCKADAIFEVEDKIDENNGYKQPALKNVMCIPTTQAARDLALKLEHSFYKFELKPMVKHQGYTAGHTVKYVGRHIMVSPDDVEYLG